MLHLKSLCITIILPFKFHAMNFIQNSLSILKANGYKITGPRMAMLGVLNSATIPLSAYDIEETIPENVPVNVVTVYRVLELFEALGIAHKVHTKEGYVRCDFETKPGCHSFAVCNTCGRVAEFINAACKTETLVPKNLPFKNLKHLSEAAGLCNPCSLSTKAK